jgi:hypothetical protein
METQTTKANLANVRFYANNAKLNANASFREKFELLHGEMVAKFPPEQRALLDSCFEKFCELYNSQLNMLFQDYLQFVCFLVDSLDAPVGGSGSAQSQDGCMFSLSSSFSVGLLCSDAVCNAG